MDLLGYFFRGRTKIEFEHSAQKYVYNIFCLKIKEKLRMGILKMNFQTAGNYLWYSV